MARPTSALSLPAELTIEIFSHLDPHSLARALTACTAWNALTCDAWRAACSRRWPRWSAIAAGDQPAEQPWRRVYELLLLRTSEVSADVPAIRKLQQAVQERQRAILVEWLVEVSFDWDLDSAVVFKAVGYLDCYLQQTRVEHISRFQLLGLACLRAAMGDARKDKPLQPGDKSLDPQLFAYISDDTYSPAEVEQCTQEIAAAVPDHLRSSPNAKMFLRSFWYRAIFTKLVVEDEMHIYILASFLLQLGLLDLSCSGVPASKLAAAAFSVALHTFGKAEWPASLQQFGSYPPDELADTKQRLAALQATLEASQLRTCWRQKHEMHGYEEYGREWDRLLLLFATCSRLGPPPAAAGQPATPKRGAAVDMPAAGGAEDMLID